jgi:alpha-galactosidase
MKHSRPVNSPPVFPLWTPALLLLTLLTTLDAQAADKPLKVFILAGQSNMVGHGKAEEGRNPKFDPAAPKGKENPEHVVGGPGSLRGMVNESPAKFGAKGTTPLVDRDGKWLVRDDVKIYAYCNEKTRKGGLGLGYAEPGALTWFGPEFGFGHSMGNALDEDVLLIKISTGGTSLAVNWRPPGAVAERGGEVGPQYAHMVKTAKEVLADVGNEFPEFKGRKVEVAGFGWHQGWQDGCDPKMAAEYEANMADFIEDTRKEFGAGMAFVIANSGFMGNKQKGIRAQVREAQDAIADARKYPKFKGNVAVVDTRPMWRDETVSPSNFGFHWNHNGPTHYEMGAAMGEAMLKLMKR